VTGKGCARPDGKLKGDLKAQPPGRLFSSMAAVQWLEHWYYEDEQGELRVIDELREKLRSSNEAKNI
jgi:hypothetical protein